VGDILSAEEVLEIGLVRSVHEPRDLLPAAYDLAQRLTHLRSGVGIAMIRKMFYRNHAFTHPADAHRAESLAMWHASVGDGKEGVRAFLESAIRTSRAA
jgi:enoyl-CoA hydratase/carnithine racemase